MLIVIEGIDKSGKDTLACGLAEARRAQCGCTPPVLHEPSPYGESGIVRAYLRGKTRGEAPASWPQETWICAFVGAMLAQDESARLFVADHRDVIYVRRELSTLVYQCYVPNRGELATFVYEATRALAKPDVLILLDGDPKKFAKRGTTETRDNTAHEGIDEQRRLRAAYLSALSDYQRVRGVPVCVINAEQSIEDVLAEALRTIEAP